MRGSKSAAAIRAGLMGSCAVALECAATAQPALAEASSSSSILQSAYVYPFAAGVIAGSILTGTVCGISLAVQARRDRRRQEGRADDTAVFDLADLSDTAAQQPVSPSATSDLTSQAARNAAAKKTASKKTASASVATAAKKPVPPVATSAAQKPTSAAKKPAASAAKKSASAPATATNRPADQIGTQEDWDAWGSHLSNDLEDVAANYVERLTFAERVASKARGVREVLGERLGMDRDAFDGLPIIERADGTVGDVGTSWWNNRLGDSVRSVNENTQATGRIMGVDKLAPGAPQERVARPAATPRPAASARPAAAPNAARPATARPAAASAAPRTAAQRMANVPNPAVQAEAVPDWMSNTARSKVDPRDFRGISTTSRSAIIASRIAEVDQGVFPARRDVRDLDHDDMWDAALASMDEKISAFAAKPSLVTAEEAQRQSERQVQLDIESHVDQLVNEEFARRRRASHPTTSAEASGSWRVLDGALSADSTNVLSGRRRSQRKAEYQPKHMAVARVAREA